ncbi:integrin beta-nu-like, partial [Asbolus verrucosus]
HFEGPRCSIKNVQFSKCNPIYIVNNTEANANIRQNATFADVDTYTSQAVQFRPREFDVNLRLGQPVNISIQYQPARNFHLDLYYLMDLTKSMQPDLTTITLLGKNLTQLLEKLTNNHHIAFGSYIDKPVMPFYLSEEEDRINPCLIEHETCEMGYIFRHRLNFTDEIDEFIKKVENSTVSANLDNLEGGMDALMQILLCGSKIGWSENSRKLVIIATDGKMHFAGDGLLSGTTKRNRDQCLIDSQDNEIYSTSYDYPSLEEIHHELKRKKTNIIIAAKDTTKEYYDKMHQLIPDATFVGELKNDSTNILNLVMEGYYAFMKQVSLSIETIDGLQVDFFADCEGNGRWKKTDICSNAEEGKPIDFIVQFLLNRYQDIESKTLYIEESKINEKIQVNVNFVGSMCNCPKVSTQKECVNGIVDCGNCTCNEGWQGDACDEPCDNNLNNCRFLDNGILSLTCSGRGDCLCSECDCYFPFDGKFCQYSCPFEPSSKLICGGHGSCINGECKCNNMYSGADCTCFESQQGCQIPGTDLLCNGNGICQCNECRCNTGYRGRYCEICEECQGLCDNYEKCVEESLENESYNCSKGNGTIQVEIVTKLKKNIQNCRYIFDRGEDSCSADYTYTIHKDRSVYVEVEEPKCSKPLGAGFLAGIIVAAIFGAGLLLVLAWKGRNMYRDKIEYEEFMRNKGRSLHSEQNPIYKSPVTTYNNPMEMTTLRSRV